MKARRLISGATFGPATLKVIGQAFDQAWAEAKDNFTTPEEKAAARLCIAEGILANARENSRDMDELRVAGHMALIREAAGVLAGGPTEDGTS